MNWWAAASQRSASGWSGKRASPATRHNTSSAPSRDRLPGPNAPIQRSCSAALPGNTNASSKARSKRLGYLAEPMPTPTVAAFPTGKEFGNNGQCNPTYFTVGNLVQFLQKLEARGMSKRPNAGCRFFRSDRQPRRHNQSQVIWWNGESARQNDTPKSARTASTSPPFILSVTALLAVTLPSLI